MAQNRINIEIVAKDNGSAVVKNFGKSLDDTSTKAGGFKESLGRIRDVALGVYLPQLAAKVLDIGKAAIASAADYEQSLNVFRSVSNATAADMGKVAARARELGNDITLPGISAKDAAQAMVELSKAGLSVNDTLGASKGVLALAKAGQLDTAEAARIAANALNAFSLEGSQASRVADILSAAANASSADVGDLAYGFQMASSSFAAVKAPIDDLAVSLALMSNNGIAGSDAGTSLKTMFMNLIPTTKRARDSMKDLGLDFYNAEGQFVGVRDLITQLQKGTAKLTDEQRALHIENIFGADSSRAANVLIKEGIEGYDAMSKAVNRQGAATELAAAQNAGFNGAIDSLKSSLETVGIDIGTKFLPVLTTAAMFLSGNVQPTFEAVRKVVVFLYEGFKQFASAAGDYLMPKLTALWDSLRNNVTPALTDLWKEVIQPLIPVVGVVLVGAFGALIDVARTVIDVSGFLYEKFREGNPIVVGLAGVFGTLAAAMAFNAVFNAMSLGFSTMTLVTIPSVMASVTALKLAILAPLVMPAIVVGAALAALALVFDAANRAKTAVEGAKAAQAQSEKAGEQLRASADTRYKNGQIDAAERLRLYAVSRLATGTNSAAGGVTLVGEHGPELVNLPSGAQVTPAWKTASQGGSEGGVVNNYSGNFTFANQGDIDYFFERANKTQRYARLGVAG